MRFSCSKKFKMYLVVLFIREFISIKKDYLFFEDVFIFQRRNRILKRYLYFKEVIVF